LRFGLVLFRLLVAVSLALIFAGVGSQGAAFAAWPWAAPPRAQTPHPAVARIIVPEGEGVTSFGSGTLIDARDDFGLVITNWHVVRDAAGRIEVVFPNGFRSFARALKVNDDWDLAALVIWRPDGVRPVPLADIPPRPGDALTIAGYGSGTYRAATGRCTKYFAPSLDLPKQLVEVSVQARQGDSGGPILNARGELAGVLFGASRGTTMGSYAPRVRDFLASVAPDLGQNTDTRIAATDEGEKGREGEGGTRASSLLPHSPPPPLSPSPPHVAARPAEKLETVPPRDPVEEDWSQFVQLSDNPPPRPTAEVAEPPAVEPSAPAVAALSNEAGEAVVSRPLTWRDLAGETLFEQARSVLALVGVFTVVYQVLRAFGG
jgi:hypothetical protein